jgi:hypothetical protein
VKGVGRGMFYTCNGQSALDYIMVLVNTLANITNFMIHNFHKKMPSDNDLFSIKIKCTTRRLER